MLNDKMNRQIKLIWDFKGDDAEQTAAHHIIHINEFIAREKLNLNKTAVQVINPLYAIAYMLVEESNVYSVRDALKPHRAEIVE